MAVSTLIPQAQQKAPRQANSWARLLPAVGTVVGGVAGSVIPGAGTMAGAGIGATIGGLAQVAVNETSPSPSAVRAPQPMAVENDSQSAMARRQAIAQEDPMEQLRRANYALDAAPKDIQDAYRKPLQEAMTLARKQNEMGYA